MIKVCFHSLSIIKYVINQVLMYNRLKCENVFGLIYVRTVLYARMFNALFCWETIFFKVKEIIACYKF